MRSRFSKAYSLYKTTSVGEEPFFTPGTSFEQTSITWY